MSVKFYDEQHAFPTFAPAWNTQITVEDKDTFGAAQEHDNACCLNFASHRRPGGGYESVMAMPMPIRTQEEDLFRRSNLPDLMDTAQVRRFYPLSGVQGLYCRGIVVTKDQHLRPCQPFETALVTVPALVAPKPEQEPVTDAKIQRILQIAADNRHTTLILGAWGCGAFRNDPETVANLFKKWLTGEFAGVFETVVFAIPGKDSRNYQVFESVLQ